MAIDPEDAAKLAVEAWLEAVAVRDLLSSEMLQVRETPHTMETIGILLEQCRMNSIEKLRELHPNVAKNVHLE